MNSDIEIALIKHDIEIAAKAIFEHWQFQKENGSTPIKWIEGGNSLKQEEARTYARVALESTTIIDDRVNSTEKSSRSSLFNNLPDALENIELGKKQWDYVAECLGVHGDDVDAVFKAAEHAKSLIQTKQLSDIEEPNELVALYKAASVGFHVSNSYGPGDTYQYISKFRSLQDLFAYEKAWTDAMLKAKESIPTE